jgi:MFS family permease
VSETPEETHAHSRRNFWLCVANGGGVLMGMAFFAHETVLATLAEQLTHSTFCVGLLVSLGSIGWMWPQLFVGNYVETMRRKKPIYILSSATRVLMLLLMALTLYLWRGSPTSLFWVLLLLFFTYCSAGGMGVIPFMDIVAKSVPHKQMSMLWASRRLIGGLLGAAASLLVAYILSARSGIAFPSNYALLLLLGALISGVAYSFFVGSRERPEQASETRVSFLTFLKRGPVIFSQDHDFRRFFYLKAAWAIVRMSQGALFVPMAVQYFGASPKETAGWFTLFLLLIGGFSSFTWGLVARRYGEIRIMEFGAVFHVVSLLMALVLAGSYFHAPAFAVAQKYYLIAYAVMYLFGTAAINACDIGGSVYLLSLPPAQLRPSYFAFINTLTIPLMFAPALAGYLALHISYASTFAISCTAALFALFIAARLKPRAEGDVPEMVFNEGPGSTRSG